MSFDVHYLYKLNQRSLELLREQLVDARKELGFDQTYAAELAGTSNARLSRFEAGKENFSLESPVTYAASIGQMVSFDVVPHDRAEKQLGDTVRRMQKQALIRQGWD